MSETPPALDFHSMPIGAGYARPAQNFPGGLSVDSPALQAMTDLRKVTALTVERTNTLAATRERMQKLGVRMLLVTGSTGAVMGVVTVTDLDSGAEGQICGIFSLTRLCGQIGLDIQPGAAMRSIEQALKTVLD